MSFPSSSLKTKTTPPQTETPFLLQCQTFQSQSTTFRHSFLKQPMPPIRRRTRVIEEPESSEPAISSPHTPAELLELEEQGITNAIVEALENLAPNTKKAYTRIWTQWNQWGSGKGYRMESKGVLVTGPRLNLFISDWLSKQVISTNGSIRKGQPYSFSYQEQYVNAIKKLYDIQVMTWFPLKWLANSQTSPSLYRLLLA